MSDEPGRDLHAEAQLKLFRLKDLPPAPGMLQEALRVVGDEKAALRDVAAVIERSPELVARILRCANSSYYGQRRRIVTVEEAIIRVLGLSTTKGLVVAMSLSNAFNLRACPNFQIERHWLTALVTADLSEKLAVHLDPPVPLAAGTAYAAGLLHNLGLLALVHTFPRELDAIFAAGSVAEGIRREFDLSHQEAGAQLALRWGLPEVLLQAAAHNADPAYRGAGWRLAALVGLSKAIAEALYDGASPSNCPLDRPGDLGLSDETLTGALEQVHGDLTGLRELAAELSGKGS